jgi:hypothetical protein
LKNISKRAILALKHIMAMLCRACHETSGHNQKQPKQLIHVSGKRFHFFTNSIVNKWNSLTAKVVSYNNVNIFKNNFDRFETINKKNMIDK